MFCTDLFNKLIPIIKYFKSHLYINVYIWMELYATKTFPIRTRLTSAYQLKISCTVKRGLARELGDLRSSLGFSLMQVGLWKHYYLGLSSSLVKVHHRLDLIIFNGCNTLENLNLVERGLVKIFCKRLGRKYFQLWGPDGFCYSLLPL